MPFMGLSRSEREALEYEVVSAGARLKLTRLLRSRTSGPDHIVSTIHQNRAVNIARAILKLPIFVLESDTWGEYDPVIIGWHLGELELVMRRPSTTELVETLADLIQEGVLETRDVNAVLAEDGSTISFQVQSCEERQHVSVLIAAVPSVSDEPLSGEHPNIRVLVSRMERELAAKDYSAVLHASGSIFETLAKDLVDDPAVQHQSLGKFFDKYSRESKLSPGILNFIKTIFQKRNTEPLAGHGSTEKPKITQTDAVLLAQMTKAFIRAERMLTSVAVEKRTLTLTEDSGTVRLRSKVE